MYSRACPHDCLDCNGSSIIYDGLTRETAIEIRCPMCEKFLAPSDFLICKSCNKTFTYTLKPGLWYIGEWYDGLQITRYRGGF